MVTGYGLDLIYGLQLGLKAGVFTPISAVIREVEAAFTANIPGGDKEDRGRSVIFRNREKFRWLNSTNHKEIALLYIYFGTLGGIVGSLLS